MAEQLNFDVLDLASTLDQERRQREADLVSDTLARRLQHQTGMTPHDQIRILFMALSDVLSVACVTNQLGSYEQNAKLCAEQLRKHLVMRRGKAERMVRGAYTLRPVVDDGA